MKRIYKQGVRNDVKYFKGREVEKTPLFGENTLFVVGVQPAKEIITLAKNAYCEHVYFGTGTSFLPKNQKECLSWNRMIKTVLDDGMWATLDFDIQYSQMVQNMSVSNHRRFIPMISVKIAHLRKFNYNATVKLDDVDFDATNPGVWCWPLEKLLDRQYFTDWEHYTNDTIIEDINHDEDYD